MAQLFTLIGIRHSARTPYSPWTNGLVEVQNKNRGTDLRMFLQNTLKDWAYQVHMYANGHNSQPGSSSNVSPHEIVFHTKPRIPLTFGQISTVPQLEHLFQNIALTCQNIRILTKQILILYFIVHSLNLFLNNFLQ